MLKNNKAFTLIEVLLSILILSIVTMGGFEALSAITLGKVKLVEKTDITKESFYFNEKLFEEIKKGGTIDYEEYFNRKVVGNTTFSSGHYDLNTGWGNFGNGGSNPGTAGATNYGNGFYYCRSTNIAFGTGGCYNDASFNNLGLSNGPQRYGQYIFQFIDYNSNLNLDGGLYGDEDGDLNIRGDDDDENLGEGPAVFVSGIDAKEIYLVSGDGKKRTLFRWNWKVDPNKPSTSNCDSTTFGTGCLGTIEFLKLEGKDWGLNHDPLVTSAGSFDGIIDTWIIDKEFTGGTQVIAGNNDINYWQPLFSNNISVTDFQVYMFPNINRKYDWKTLVNNEVNPYLKIKITLTPSWKKRGAIKGKVPEINLLTTINLSDYFSK